MPVGFGEDRQETVRDAAVRVGLFRRAYERGNGAKRPVNIFGDSRDYGGYRTGEGCVTVWLYSTDHRSVFGSVR